ncbi:MAG: hypothetical protein IJA92_01060 [Oscillospiraceae bacterium]|nr:hypothetical protein [Oscillospiraceae bacterium]
MKDFFKKFVLYALAFIALWLCSIFVLWIFSLFLATSKNGIIWDGFKTGALAFAILFLCNWYSKRKNKK